MRIQESEERKWFSIAKHVNQKLACHGEPGRAAGALIFDGAATVHRVQFYPYDLLDLVSYGTAGIRPTKLRAGLPIPQQMLDAPE